MEAVAALILSVILNSATGEKITVDVLADDLARRDVVFLGEEHDNAEGHKLQMQIIEALWQRRPDLVLSLEMFERDVQGAVDDYLKGRLSEAEFLKHSRPWPNYKEHYRPVIEFAKEKKLDVLAANVARGLARKVTSRGLEAVAGQPGLPRTTSATRGKYFDLFAAAMADHVGTGSEEALEKMYLSQCLKDDAMAEAITDYIQQHGHRRPLIVHLTGKFHCEYGLGTAVRVLERRPLTLLGVLTMIPAEDVEKVQAEEHKDKAHFLLVVPEEPKKDDGKKGAKEGREGEAAATPEGEAEAVAAGAAMEGEKEKPAEVPAEPKPEPAPQEEGGDAPPGRPALGIMPDYGATAPGVTVSGTTAGGAAEAAGLKGGDRIVKIGDEKIGDIEDYMSVLEGHKPGQTVEVTFIRDGSEQTVKVKLGVSRRG